MARIRTMKPEFWQDEKLAPLAPIHRLVFLGLISMADDAGRLLDNVKVIDAFIFPETADSSRDSLDVLANLSRIIRYVSGSGQHLIQISNWRHQKVDKPNPHVLPPPPDGQDNGRKGVTTIRESVANRSRSARESVAALSSSGYLLPTTNEAERYPRAREDIGPRSTIPADPDPLALAEIPAPAAPPRVVLPLHAQQLLTKCYGLSTEKRRTDVAKQLYDALDPELKGARLRRGTYVRARDAGHLDFACKAVLDDAPRDIDMAIVFVLQKLQDPPPGPSPTEVAATREAGQRKLEEQYGAEAKRAAVAWSREHPDEYRSIAKPIEAQFPNADSNGWMATAKSVALASAVARAAGFPRFEEWRASTNSQQRSA